MLALAVLLLAPWTAPRDVSTPHRFVDAPSVSFAADGTGLATWAASDEGTGSVDDAALAAAAPAFSAQQTIAAGPRPSVVSAPAHYGRTRTVALTQRPLSGERVRLAAMYGRATGSFGAPRTIAVRRQLRDPQLVTNPSGAAAVAWFEDRGVSDDRVYLSYRRPAGRYFGRPVLLATDRVRSVSVALSVRGDLLVAWDARGTVRTRSKPASKPLFGSVQSIASEPTYYAALRSAVTPNGRAYVAWGAQLLTEGGDRGPVYYEAAVRPAGAARFRPAQLLERQSAAQAQGGLDLVTDADNGARVAWTGWDGTHYRVRAASTGAGAVFGAAQDVAEGVEAALAGAPDGRALVAWNTDAEGGAIGAAIAPAGGAFGPAEAVTAGPEARVPAAAFGGDRWALVWSNRPAGEARPPQTFLQASLRPAAP